MSRLLVLVEGETEETFVNELLRPHLCKLGFRSVGARLLGNARNRSRRGGIRHWPAVMREITTFLKADSGLFLTTFVDYYGLPARENDHRSWPGASRAKCLDPARRGRFIQECMTDAVHAELSQLLDCRRFIPFVVVHEFEGLLFSDCNRFAAEIGRTDLTGRFTAIRSAFASPEEINDSPGTHPSKRIQELFPGYQKVLHGNLAALEIGLVNIRMACPHFHAWLTELEAIVAKAP